MRSLTFSEVDTQFLVAGHRANADELFWTPRYSGFFPLHQNYLLMRLFNNYTISQKKSKYITFS